MIARSVEIDDELRLRPFPTADAADACQRAEARIWVDLEAFEPAELEAGWTRSPSGAWRAGSASNPSIAPASTR